MLGHILLYFFAFVGIWVGAGIAISAVERLSHSLRLSSFAVSFLILGFFTSISELSVGINSVMNNDPEIYVGNLIGASIVILLMIVPLLAITGNKIHIAKEFQGFNLIMSLVVIAAPVVFSFDGRVEAKDSIAAIVLYIMLVLAVQTKRGLLQKMADVRKLVKPSAGQELFKIVVGVAIIFIASHYVVEQTKYFSVLFGLSPFLISLILIGIGTNLPELSLVVRSVFRKSNQVAFGDYVGSASFNTFLFGMLTLLYGRPVFLTNSYLVSLVFSILGVILFYQFAKSRNTISRREGYMLLTVYAVFLVSEVLIHML